MFLPVNGDQYRNNVVLHLPMTGANNSTTFTDVSPSPKTITRYGDTKISTAQSKWGQGSGYFDGTGDYLTAPNSADFLFGSDSFTVESWIYPTTLPTAGSGGCIASVYDTTNNKRSWTLNVFNDGGVFKLQLFVSTSGLSAGVTAFLAAGLSLNQWQHVAVSRSGNTMRLLIGGVIVVETSYTSALYHSDVVLGIGRYASDSAIYTGYLQDLRITKGVARYTANFAVPSGPLPARLPELPVQRIQQPSFHQIARLGL